MNRHVINCPECGQPIAIQGTGKFSCPHCGQHVDVVLPFRAGVRQWFGKHRVSMSMSLIVLAIVFFPIFGARAFDSGLGSVLGACMGLVIIAGLFCLYFLPAIIAGGRRHRNANGILIINLLLGWTLLGWIGALVWSVYQEKK